MKFDDFSWFGMDCLDHKYFLRISKDYKSVK